MWGLNARFASTPQEGVLESDLESTGKKLRVCVKKSERGTGRGQNKTVSVSHRAMRKAKSSGKDKIFSVHCFVAMAEAAGSSLELAPWTVPIHSQWCAHIRAQRRK